MLDFVIEDLKKVLVDFYNVLGCVIVLYDENKNIVYSYPDCSSFCYYLNEDFHSEEISRKCKDCDAYALEACAKSNKPYIYTCHMGLTEVMTAIRENNIIIGYIQFGQVLCNYNKKFIVDNIRKICVRYNFSEKKMLEALEELPHMEKEFIESAATLMSMCVCYLYVSKIIQSKNDVIEHQLKKYVENNLFSDLSVPAVCKKFYISKSKLYNLSLDLYGMGLSDYVREQRIAAAKNKLLTTQRSVSQIASETGFSDANYFSRTFKKYVGVTPIEYRTNNV